MEPSVVLFGDSCPGTDKYLEVQFQCLQVAEEEEEERWEPRFPDTQISQLWDPSHKFISQEAVRASLSIVRNRVNNVVGVNDAVVNDFENYDDVNEQDKEEELATVNVILKTSNSTSIISSSLKTSEANFSAPSNQQSPSLSAEIQSLDNTAANDKTLQGAQPVLVVGRGSRKMVVMVVIGSSCLALCLIILAYCSFKLKRVRVYLDVGSSL